MISFENVFYTYAIKTPYECLAIKNINFTIKNGELVFIVGKTGSGKSTLIQHLNGLLIPSEGKVKVDNFVLSRKRKEATKKIAPLRKKVGVVFQFSENQLFEDTLEKDVAFGPMNFKVKKDDALKIAHEVLKQVGLGEEYFKRSPFELSGGEKRKAAIAGILALNPDVLVLDEPTSGLDMKSKKEVMKLFLELNQQGKTVIIVTHDMNLLLEYGKRVIVMKDGELIDDLTVGDFFYRDHKFDFLEVPEIVKMLRLLFEDGHKLSYREIKDVDSLASELKKESEK